MLCVATFALLARAAGLVGRRKLPQLVEPGEQGEVRTTLRLAIDVISRDGIL